MRRATVEQTKSSVNTADYSIIEAGQTVCEAHSNYVSLDIMNPLCLTSGGRDYSFHRNLLQGAKSLRQYDVMDIYEGEEKLGYICGNAVYLSGSKTYAIQWKERRFTAYVVGLGKQGIKLPIFEDERQVALIEKGGVVFDMLDAYELYTTEDALFEMAVLTALYYDRDCFSNAGQSRNHSIQHTSEYTVRKKQLARYDESWVAPFLSAEEIQRRADTAEKPMSPLLRVIIRAMPFIILMAILIFYFYFYQK